MSAIPARTGTPFRIASCPDLPGQGDEAIRNDAAPESAQRPPGASATEIPRQQEAQAAALMALSELGGSRSSAMSTANSNRSIGPGEWEMVSVDLEEIPPLSYPLEAVRSDVALVSLVCSVAGYYWGKSSNVSLDPPCAGAPDCLDRVKRIIEKGEFMGAGTTCEWIDQMGASPSGGVRDGAAGGSREEVLFFSKFLTEGSVQDFSEVSQGLQQAIRERPRGKTLLAPLILAGGTLKCQHIVCLAVSDRGLEYFDSQQTSIRGGKERGLSCGGSLGQLLSAAWHAVVESAAPEIRWRMSTVGNTETQPLQQNWWSCGVYVVGYMRERMHGASHAEAMHILATKGLSRLHTELWTDLNRPTKAQRERHSLATLVGQLESVMTSGPADSLDQAFAITQRQDSAVAPDAADLSDGFDVVEALPTPRLNLELLLQALSHRQSVDCRGLCVSSAEGPNREVRSREAVLHQVTVDLQRTQVIELEEKKSEVVQSKDRAQAFAQEALGYIQDQVKRVLTEDNPHVVNQLLGICCQAPGASLSGALMFMACLLEDEDRLMPVHITDSGAGCMVTHIDRDGLHHKLSVPIAFKRMNDGSCEEVSQVMVSSEFRIRWNDLQSLLAENGTRLDLSSVRGTLTVEPLPSSEPHSAGEGSSSS